jgi:hypothetical protein
MNKSILRIIFKRKFNSRRSILETERQVDIEKSVEQNLTKFKKGLPGVQKYIEDIQKLNDDYQSFKQNMNKMLESKKDKLTNTADLLEKKLETWKNTRRWSSRPDFVSSYKDEDPVSMSKIFSYLESVCEEEAIKAYDNSKKGLAIRQLDAQKEEAENALYSGGSLSAVRNYIHGIFSNAGITDNVAKKLVITIRKIKMNSKLPYYKCRANLRKN